MSTDVVSIVRMSDVRRIPDSSNAPCARRALFGPVDHEENRKFVESELVKIEEEQRLRWNFDFRSEKPLKGRYEWEKVETMPLTFRLPVQNVCRESTVTSALDDSPNHKNRSQTKITDFMRSKKSTRKPYRRAALRNSKHTVRRTAS